MSDSFDHNAPVIERRWPALFARLITEASMEDQAALVEG